MRADGEAPHVPLVDELAFLERYLDIERVRFGSRLTVVWAIAPEARPARVPPLLLQPLVENAVRHDVGPLYSPSTLRVTPPWIRRKLDAPGGQRREKVRRSRPP